ncbi:MAG: 23S rRNA (guanosine(2251)-2'-O)-methyltransferase RlmB [Pseudomonadota bacterium]
MQLQQIFGFHALMSRLKRHPDSVKEIYLDESRRDPRAQALLALAKERDIRVMPVNGSRLDGMTNNARHQGVVARVEEVVLHHHLDDLLDDLQGPPMLLVLDGVQDPHNLGACLRVADAAGVHAVIAPKDRAVGLNATVAKVASGAAETVPYITVTNLARTLRELKERSIWLVGTDDAAEKSVFQATLTGPIALVMGAEGSGMRRLTREVCDLLIHIPMAGTVESLNVSVASGVCLFEAVRQRLGA